MSIEMKRLVLPRRIDAVGVFRFNSK